MSGNHLLPWTVGTRMFRRLIARYSSAPQLPFFPSSLRWASSISPLAKHSLASLAVSFVDSSASPQTEGVNRGRDASDFDAGTPQCYCTFCKSAWEGN